MLHIARSRHALALAAFAISASLWLPSAAQGQTAPRAARPTVAAPGPAGLSLNSAPWLRQALSRVKLHHGIPRVPGKITIGDFSSCPKLPKGDDPAQFSCFLIHITGGQLIMGNSNQVINRDITIAYAEGVDPQGDTAMVFGSLTSPPMPAQGGIFLNPALQAATRGDRTLELGVQPVGLGIAPDLSGAGEGFVSMMVRAVNPVFGKHCLIGSPSDPIVTDPTFGPTNPPPPNQPITGNVASAGFNGVELIIIGTLVDNSFAAPAAHGCGPRGTFDRLVKVVGGLPSPAGTNTAIFQTTIEAVGYQTIGS